jgi:predicted CXXCH cytochrome family protein
MGWKLWMEKARHGLPTIMLGVFIAAAGSMVVTDATAQTTIKDTKHNLGSSGTGPRHSGDATNANGTSEICVFCHTPHGADSSASVPLWNRTLSASTAYTTYDQLGTTSLRGQIAPVGSVSVACLSCHDGTQAMNTVLNAPGSGTAWVTSGAGKNDAWTGTTKITGIANLGVDLRDDHPIGVQYAGGGYKKTDTAGATANKVDYKTASTATLRAGTTQEVQIWWVNTTATNSTAGREKTDMMLYTRTLASAANEQEPFVECASCHDPHSTNGTFLRIANAESAVCLSCHIK